MKGLSEEIKAEEEGIDRILNNICHSTKNKTKFRSLIPEQLETLRLFDKFNTLREIAPRSRRVYLFSLKRFGLFINKPFKEAAREDIENYLISIKMMTEASRSLNKVAIKKFYQWLYGFSKSKYPDVVDWIETGIRNRRTKLPEDLLSQEEILKLAKSTDNMRDQAIIFLLSESGLRVSELTNLKIKDFQPQNDGTALVKVSVSKTDQRVVPIISSLKTIAFYLNTHPFRDNQDAPLFVNVSRNHFGEKLSTHMIRGMLKTVAKRAGIAKKVHPHLFRHISATRDSKDFTTSLMKLKYGWRSEAMAQHYSHLSASDLISKEKERAGISERVVEDTILKPILCPKCSESNSPTNRYCSRCSTPLKEEAMMEELLAEKIVKNLLQVYPEIRALAKTKILESPQSVELLKSLKDPQIRNLLTKGGVK